LEEIPCRECSAPVDPRLAVCPQCGAPRPAQREWVGEGYEWKSAAQWMGGPIVHVAFGNGRDGRPRTARGIIAIGQRAGGGVAIGIIAGGFVSIGLVSVGVFSFGVVAIGAVLAVGGNAFGLMSIGVVAVGYKVGGVATFGVKTLFSLMK
jgi:hypothetical protein